MKNKGKAVSNSSKYDSFAQYVDMQSIRNSAIAAAAFAPLSLLAGRAISLAIPVSTFAATPAADIVALFIADSVIGGGISILQSVVDLF